MDKKSCCGAGMVAWLLMVVGGLNWGLMGIGGFMGKELNVVHMLLGTWPQVEWAVYILVGLAAVWGLVSCKQCCGGMCSTK